MKKLMFIVPVLLLLLVGFVSASLDFNTTRLFYDNGLTGSEYPKSCDYNFATDKYYFTEHRFIEEYTSIDGLIRFEGSATYNTVAVDSTDIAFARPNKNDTGYSSVDYISLNGTHLSYTAFNTPSTSTVCSRTTSFESITSDENYFYGLDPVTDIITVFDYNEDCSYSVIGTKLLPISASDMTYFTITNDSIFYGGNGNDKIYQLDYNMFLRDTYLINNSDYNNVCVDNDYLIFVNTTNSAYASLYNIPATPEAIPLTVIDGEYYGPNNCASDEITLCNDTQYFDTPTGFDTWCNNLGYQCSLIGAECISDYVLSPTYGVYYHTAYCGEPTCASECEFNLYQECLSPTSYRKCGNYDSDNCLEFSPETSCLDNFYCSSTGYCSEYNFSSITELTVALPSFYFKPEVLSEDYLTISKDTNDVYQITTTNNIYTQRGAYLSPLTTQTFYNAYDCDYQETPVYGDENSYTNNSFSISLNGNSYYTITKFNLDLNGDNDLNITLTDTVNSLAKLYVTYDNVTTNLLVYRYVGTTPTGQLLINNTGYQPYDDLSGMSFTISIYPDTELFDVYLEIDRETDVEYQTVLIDYYSSLNTGFLSMQMDSTNNITYDNLQIVRVEDRPSFDSLTLGKYNEIVCAYTDSGCRTIRSYAMGVDYGLYNNYDEMKLCLNSLGETPVQPATTLKSQLGSYSLPVRLFLLIFIVGATAIIFFVVGEHENKSRKNLGTGLIVVELVFAVTIGLIPAWIIVLAFIITAMTVTGIFRRMFIGE